MAKPFLADLIALLSKNDPLVQEVIALVTEAKAGKLTPTEVGTAILAVDPNIINQIDAALIKVLEDHGQNDLAKALPDLVTQVIKDLPK